MQRVAAGVLVVLMAAFGFGVYHYLDSQKRLRTGVQQPTETSAVAVPGTIYLAQSGSLYRLQRGRFTKLTSADGWMQPALSPDGARMVAVRRSVNFSDLYLLDASGHVQLQLTHNESNVVEHNHWAFYPRFSADGASVFYSYDPKDPFNSYRVDLAIYVLAPGSRAAPREWSYPNQYTGGDASPVPLKSGALLYAKHSIDASGQVHSQVWVQARAGSVGIALTQPDDDCGQPAVSADASLLAMACRHGETVADIEVAALDLANFTIGPPRVVVPPGLNAAPAFAPDGQVLAYMAPAGGRGPFQLWTVRLTTPTASSGGSSAAAAPARVQVTHNLSLDSTAAPAWV